MIAIVINPWFFFVVVDVLVKPSMLDWETCLTTRRLSRVVKRHKVFYLTFISINHTVRMIDAR